MDEQLWTYEDVAEYLRISWKTVRRWAGEGRLPVVRVGSLYRFEPDAIKAWAQQKES